MLDNQLNKRIGKNGENAAALYLKNNGYTILERNFYGRGFEIDIIAQDNCGGIHFVEVKTRRNDKFGCGYEFVTLKKLEKIKKGAIIYMQLKSNDNEMHFDVIEVYGCERKSILGYNKFITSKINFLGDVVG